MLEVTAPPPTYTDIQTHIHTDTDRHLHTRRRANSVPCRGRLRRERARFVHTAARALRTRRARTPPATWPVDNLHASCVFARGGSGGGGGGGGGGGQSLCGRARPTRPPADNEERGSIGAIGISDRASVPPPAAPPDSTRHLRHGQLAQLRTSTTCIELATPVITGLTDITIVVDMCQ